MSECPNCGSADDHMPHGATCRTNEAVNEATYERDQLIRSLREELAEAQSSYAQSELDLLQVIIDRDEALSLRAELVKADAECAQLQRQRDDAFRIIELAKDLAAVERDAERDRIADWLDAQGGTMSKIPDNDRCEHDQWSWTGCEMCGLAETAKALRNNEHRSNG